MKRILFVFLVMASLVLSLGNAFAEELPNFGISTEGIKLGFSQDTWQSGMHGLITDGSDVYAVRVEEFTSGRKVVMDKSNDGGLTWLHSTIASGSDVRIAAIAINPVTKELHYAWNTYESDMSRNLYYGNGTTTTRVNGSMGLISGCFNIAVDGVKVNGVVGVIHIVFAASDGQIYYTSSSDNGVRFSKPLAVAAGNWISFTTDRAGNLYIAYRGSDRNHYFIKKSAGGHWSDSYLACISCSGADPSMAVYDSERIYFAVKSKIAATSDGGKTWTSYTVPGQDHGESSLAVSPSGILNYAWSGSDGNVYFARTTKSHDPSSWGQPVIVLVGEQPNVAVDSTGKAYIMARKSEYNFIYFTKEK